MKAFIACIAFIILILALILSNMFYINHVTNEMKELADAAAQEESSDKEMSELIEYWDKHKKFVALSANYKQTDTVSEEIIKLQSARDFGNRFAIDQSHKILLDVLDDIAQYEKLSPGSIL